MCVPTRVYVHMCTHTHTPVLWAAPWQTCPLLDRHTFHCLQIYSLRSVFTCCHPDAGIRGMILTVLSTVALFLRNMGLEPFVPHWLEQGGHCDGVTWPKAQLGPVYAL